MFTRAILRRPGPDFASGLTGAALGPAELPAVLAQHAAYEAALRALGLQIEVLEPLPNLPDAWFVEDVAVVVPELAVVRALPNPNTSVGAILSRAENVATAAGPFAAQFIDGGLAPDFIAQLATTTPLGKPWVDGVMLDEYGGGLERLFDPTTVYKKK